MDVQQRHGHDARGRSETREIPRDRRDRGERRRAVRREPVAEGCAVGEAGGEDAALVDREFAPRRIEDRVDEPNVGRLAAGRRIHVEPPADASG